MKALDRETFKESVTYDWRERLKSVKNHRDNDQMPGSEVQRIAIIAEE